ncbi:MarR family winged helix-turn-helix transcriptional regulator [Alicyclobacillus acidoterrestris]|uniref:MarR family transcriptional regulator n=1 Tax=Alicyclobacillus acidoterrestris (strain ATCC 49025 / DSM 3922 / CIP 106132 / NCIMB 13137 / GD3B) TaxID=1356854 RepID=T0C953_ALIAG|nr:MarR family transcriptional regulator [Alicyclobacillus acidoterrestris]EPZ52718.1 hypothetical protein N007_19810 [Alicyclobacillus acidoterrestris ATCC 49025]UNO47624.1 MarR family transcriptional regulator [Alicyclobacillus acidoterrestris]
MDFRVLEVKSLQRSEHRLQGVKVDQIIRSFRQVDRAMGQLMRKQGDRLGLTPVQMMVLHVLYEEPDLSLNELSERLELGCSTMSGVVKRMVEAGILQRERLEQDQRTIAVRLSERGRALQQQAFGEQSMLTVALGGLRDMPADQIDIMLRIHRTLIEILKREGEKEENE